MVKAAKTNEGSCLEVVDFTETYFQPGCPIPVEYVTTFEVDDLVALGFEVRLSVVDRPTTCEEAVGLAARIEAYSGYPLWHYHAHDVNHFQACWARIYEWRTANANA
jgi:hypothetical protein